MADEEHYSNRQIERMLDLQTVEFKDIVKAATDPILTQVLKTNGRVTANEADIVAYKIWRGWMTGGMAVIMIFLPLLIGFATWMGLSVLNFGHELQTLSETISE